MRRAAWPGQPSCDRALTDLQNSTDLVISGIAARLNEHGNKSGWNSTCYMLADHWMELHGIEQARFAPGEAKTTLYAWIEQRWEEAAVRSFRKRIDQHLNWTFNTWQRRFTSCHQRHT